MVKEHFLPRTFVLWKQECCLPALEKPELCASSVWLLWWIWAVLTIHGFCFSVNSKPAREVRSLCCFRIFWWKCFLKAFSNWFSFITDVQKLWRPSVLWAQNVSPEGRARSEGKVLKFPLAVQVLGWCWAGRAGFHGMSLWIAALGSTTVCVWCSGKWVNGVLWQAKPPSQTAQRHPQSCSKRGAFPSKVTERAGLHLCHQSIPQITCSIC